MKVTFVSPYYSNAFEQLGIGYLASYCKDSGIEFRFFHENYDNIECNIDSIANSDIVAFSCTTPTYQRGIEIAKLIKERDNSIHIIMGGWHTTVTKEIPSEYIDQIVVGEGETAFFDILNGKMYVGSAYGENMILGRWKSYVNTYHGGNIGLKELSNDYIKRNFKYSILDILKSTIDDKIIIARESWWKTILQTRKFGYNAN